MIEDLQVKRYSSAYKLIEALWYRGCSATKVIARDFNKTKILRENEYVRIEAMLRLFSDIGVVERLWVSITENKGMDCFRLTDAGQRLWMNIREKP